MAYSDQAATRTTEIPPGHCQCGCGRKTTIAKRNNRRLGWIKGNPVRFIRGHHGRKSRVDYLVIPMGYKTPCWVWQLGSFPGGYGLMRGPNGKMVYAHRHYY